MFQQFNAFLHLTALENVTLAPRKALGMRRSEAREMGLAQLEHVGLVEKADTYPSALSGGQRQRLAIARALAMKPRYIPFDEIISALDPELVGEMLDTLRMSRDEGITMLCVAHKMGLSRELADRIAFFDEGVICEEGSPTKLLDSLQQPRTKQFLRQVR